jgi:hypothetical protein
LIARRAAKLSGAELDAGTPGSGGTATHDWPFHHHLPSGEYWGGAGGGCDIVAQIIVVAVASVNEVTESRATACGTAKVDLDR